MEYRFDPGTLTLDDVHRLTADMWSDIAFDETALARLKRDGLVLDGVRLTGPSPYQLRPADDGQLAVSVAETVIQPTHVETLHDLWRLHFMKGLRQGSLAA